ncbi:MAG: ester cyclase [Actinobacteria bacterium]|nr:MAG: ester cyclase [Actinomycetota bacterium]
MRRASNALGAAAVLGLVVALRRRRENPTQSLRRYYEAWAQGDSKALRSLLADDYRGHVHTLAGTEERDAEQLADLLENHAEAFEWTNFDVRDVLRDGDRLAARVTMRARHRETGREAEIDGLVILRLVGGRIAEEWSSWDYLGLAEQLGLAKVA